MSALALTASFLAIFVAIFVVILGKFIDVLTAPPTFKFLFKLSSSVKDLEAATEALRAAKEDIDLKIADAERQFRTPTNQVEGWKKHVENIITDIGEVVNKYNRRGDVPFLSKISSMYSLATECAEYHQRVKDLRTEGSSIPVVMESGSNDMFATTYEVPGSLELKYKKALGLVQQYDNSVNIIGIWGMGGVGKTTLLKKIYNSCVGSWYFQHVIWITASREHSNVSKLQSEIVKNLRLNENGDPQSQARSINSYLINKKFILFIDDLWEDVDLTEVGVPDTSSTDCWMRKVVFTTRELYVCRYMDAKEIIDVKCLDHTQSLILFKEKVGERIIQSHPLISKLAEDVAKECKGLPLALITVGRAMSTKSNVDVWKSTLNLLKNSQGHQILGVDEKLLHILKISYDYLDTDQLKKCFVAISTWPEDYKIYTEDLIEFWMGIGLIDNFESKHDIYRVGHILIRRLQDACLLEDAEDNSFWFNNNLVKMHDVLRDLALWLVSDCGKNKNNWIVQGGIHSQKTPTMTAKWREAKCISIMRNKIKKLPSDMPTCPSVLILVLQFNWLSDESELNCFCKFQSLTHLNLSHNLLNSFPESICDLTKLRYLNLSSNQIRNLPLKLGNLKGLRYLILRNNNSIRNIPSGVFAELVELLVLDMFNALFTREYLAVEVKELKSIERRLLSFGTTVGTEEELSKLMLLTELPTDDLCIHGLHSTTFDVMSKIRNAHRLRELWIENCQDGLMEIVFDKNETDQDIASLNLEILKLSNLYELKRIFWKDVAPEILFVELRMVEIEDCSLLEDITWVVYLPSLKNLSIHYCDGMRIAVNNDGDPQVLTFPSLEIFSLTRMNKLEKISTRSVAFPQLKKMIIIACPLLKALPLEVKTTPKLRNIHGEEEWWEKVEWEDNISSSYFNQFFNHTFD